MNEEFVTFNLAKKLKEKGFNKHVCGYYWETGRLSICNTPMNSNALENEFSAPTISQVLKWLREEKKIYLELVIVVDAEYMCDIYKIDARPIECLGSTEYSKTYEDAAIAGIEYVIDNLI